MLAGRLQRLSLAWRFDPADMHFRKPGGRGVFHMSTRSLLIFASIGVTAFLAMLLGGRMASWQPTGHHAIMRLDPQDGAKYLHPITVQPGRVVVFEPRDVESLRTQGLIQVKDHLDGIEFRFSDSMNAIELEKRVRRLAAGNAGLFVSPIFRDESNWEFFLRPELLVSFRNEVGERQAERILGEFEAGPIVQKHFAGMHNVYLLSSPLRDGFALLRLTNAIAEYADVQYAEPDMICQTRSLHEKTR